MTTRLADEKLAEYTNSWVDAVRNMATELRELRAEVAAQRVTIQRLTRCRHAGVMGGGSAVGGGHGAPGVCYDCGAQL